jgi:hypothetical protein
VRSRGKRELVKSRGKRGICMVQKEEGNMRGAEGREGTGEEKSEERE